MNSREILAVRLEERMKTQKIGKAKLAKAAGISRVTLDTYLSSDASAGLDIIERLALCLETTPAKLLEGQNEHREITPAEALHALHKLVETRAEPSDSMRIKREVIDLVNKLNDSESSMVLADMRDGLKELILSRPEREEEPGNEDEEAG